VELLSVALESFLVEVMMLDPFHLGVKLMFKIVAQRMRHCDLDGFDSASRTAEAMSHQANG
jgi:hypothetical protein